MREIRIPVPRWPRNLTGNLIGVTGLAGVCFFVGALLEDFRWTGLLGSICMVGLAIVNGRAAVQEPAALPAVVGPTPIRKTAAAK